MNKMSVLAIGLVASLAHSSELVVDLNDLSNVTEVESHGLTLISEFHGYELDEGRYRYANDVDLDGLDWSFWYGEHQHIAKPEVSYISNVRETGNLEKVKNGTTKNAIDNRYYWDGGSSLDYSDQLADSAIIHGNGGYEFTVAPGKEGEFVVELYTHNWLSSSDVTACLKNQCTTVQNDISFHMTSVKNTIRFQSTSPDDQLVVTYSRSPRQFDFEQDKGYHALEAIQFMEVR